MTITQAMLDAVSLELIGRCGERNGDPDDGRHMLHVAAPLLAQAREDRAWLLSLIEGSVVATTRDGSGARWTRGDYFLRITAADEYRLQAMVAE